MNEFFHRIAHRSALLMGSHWSFLGGTLACVLWAATGPLFGYSDTWQLVINTATTVLTFLAVFLIQNSQNRDGLAIQLKLDELLRAVENARTGMVSLENCSEAEIERLRQEFERLRAREATNRRAE